MNEPAIVATGSALPPKLRKNTDPIFTWLNAHKDAEELFKGYEERRVLDTGESITDYAVRAGASALAQAGIAAGDVDLVVGYISVSEHEVPLTETDGGPIGGVPEMRAVQTPNDLQDVAKRLGVKSSAIVLPINNEFANYCHGLVVADAMLRAGNAANALIVVGTNWSRYVDYHTPQAASAADGAGAAVMTLSERGQYRIVDTATDSDRSMLLGMYMAADPTTPPRSPATSGPIYFHLDEPMGVNAFRTFGVERPPSLVREVLERHGLTPADISFVGHQASEVLNAKWSKALQPKTFVETLKKYANMTAASIAVNLDVCADQIDTRYVALAALGPEPTCVVVLLERIG